MKAEEEEKKMEEMALALKNARHLKLEEQHKAEDIAKHKEEMQTGPLTSIKELALALKKAKAENLARDKTNDNIQ